MSEQQEVVVIGAGVAGLSAAALLAQRGRQVLVLEQNWLPGGCASSYPRHGYIFEAGATTLVGLDEGMPLKWLLDQTGIKIEALKLETPMQVHFPDGQVLTRHQNLGEWIAEAERVFGASGQRAFWEECFHLSQMVWRTSLRQTRFPPTSLGDLLALMGKASFSQLKMLPRAFQTTADLLRKHGLHENARFCAFVDAQLLISAQNNAGEVNALFGAAALCYTNYGNYYVPGGMLQLVQPIAQFITQAGGEVRLRQRVTRITHTLGGYEIHLQKHPSILCKHLISSIPLNNILPLMDFDSLMRNSSKVIHPEKLWSAFTMGIAFKGSALFPAIHHQILLDESLPEIGSNSIFVSLSHPEDHLRCKSGECVAAVSTHIAQPHLHSIYHKAQLEERIVSILEEKGILRRADILYQHSSGQKSWEKWTGRAYGFVGGYPQYKAIKPWQMKDARLDRKSAYICGDSTYPGQGIPGACLSGIIAVEKLAADQGWGQEQGHPR
jgi:C-3',4' desaturase CrtD